MTHAEDSWETYSRLEVIKIAEAYEKELAFLRYFYAAAGDAFGPADSDIYQMIKDNYDGELPEGY